MNIVPLIVCGGGGQRLWPKSRPALPKPFVALPDGGTLLARAYRRALAAPSLRAVVTVAAADHGFLCAEEFRRAGGGAEHLFVGEPEGKNTAPAIAVGCELARARFGDDCVVAVLPADHLVDSDSDFWRAFAAAESRLAAGAIAVLGIAPTHAATGYGYIERGRALGEDLFAVARFVEKPDRARAESFLRDGGFFWNAGVFGFSAAAGCAAVARCAPSLAARAQKIAARFDGGSDLAADADLYRGFDSISFDYAVMEKIAADGETECAVAAARCGWSDIGSWRAFADAFGGKRDGDGNAAIGDALWRDSSGCFAWSDSRLVAAIGARDLRIIDSPDALLVVGEGKDEEVRALCAQLAAQNRPQASAANPARRPWGSYAVLHESPGCKVKRIEVAPGGKLSLQSHRHRSEHWTTALGVMRVTIEERTFDMAVDESCHIPRGAKHRMENATDSPAALIEVQIGDYLEEDDITRYEDIYGRA